MTGKALAERIGMGQRSMSKRLVGAVVFKAAEVAQIADVLGIPVAELLRVADGVGRAAGNSGDHSVSPAPASPGDAGSRERLDGPAAYPNRAAS